MLDRILVVFEYDLICRPAVDYARELAQRMDAEVTFLMVVEMAFMNDAWLGSKRNAINELDERAGSLLTPLVAEFLHEGIATSAALRVGDPGQEFLKFLAERVPFQVVIWGSSEEIPSSGRRGHWLSKAAVSLECSLWTISSRKTGPKNPVKTKTQSN